MASDHPEVTPPALLSVAEILAEAARATIDAAWSEWEQLAGLPMDPADWTYDTLRAAFTEGWRRALEWYIVLAQHRPADAEQLGRAAFGTVQAEDQAEVEDVAAVARWRRSSTLLRRWRRGELTTEQLTAELEVIEA